MLGRGNLIGCCYISLCTVLRRRLAAELGELLADLPLVLLDVLAGLAGAPSAGHQEDERDEHGLAADTDPPPGLPVLRVLRGGLLDLGAVGVEDGELGSRLL